MSRRPVPYLPGRCSRWPRSAASRVADRPPAAAQVARTADYVVIVGVAGPALGRRRPETTTPHLWNARPARLDRLAVGALGAAADLPGRRLADARRRQLRGLGAHRAGRRGVPAVGRRSSSGRTASARSCPTSTSSRSATTRTSLTWGAVPGALAESVRCTVAVGPGAAVARGPPVRPGRPLRAGAARRPGAAARLLRAQHRRPGHGRRRRPVDPADRRRPGRRRRWPACWPPARNARW